MGVAERRVALALTALSAPWSHALDGPAMTEGETAVRVGVLAYRPLDQTRAQWEPTMAALDQAVAGHRFELVAMNYLDLTGAMGEGRLDFLLTNPEHFALLRAQYGLSAIATLIPLADGHPAGQFGGVVVTLTGRADIRTLADLRGKTIASPSASSLGAYAMQGWELMKVGVDITRGGARMRFLGLPQDLSIQEVLAGRADAAFVRTGVLEAMAAEGVLDLAQIHVINPQTGGGVSHLRSTELCPEWPFAATRAAPPSLVKAVSLALLNIEPGSAAAVARGYYGFAPPADYSPIEALMQRLRRFPGRLEGLELRDIAEKYGLWIDAGLAILMGVGLLAGWRMVRDGRRLRRSARRMSQLLNGLVTLAAPDPDTA